MTTLRVRQGTSLRKPPDRPHLVTLCAFYVGAALAMSFLSSVWGGGIRGAIAVAIIGAVCSAIWWGGHLVAARSRWARWLGGVCGVILIACWVLWAYLAVAFGILLGWTVPYWALAFIGLAAVAAAATASRPRDRARVPVALPIGMWIATLMTGWLREENLLRCDDYLALRSPVQLVLPSQARLKACEAGVTLQAGRFPRTFWESPGGERLIFSTQGGGAPEGFAGSVCEAHLDTGATRCVGPSIGKSQALIEVPDRDRLLAMQYGVTTPNGVRGGVVFEIPRRGGIEILAEHWFDEEVGEGFYEPRNATLYMFSDVMNGVHRAVLPGFEPAPTIPIEFFTPGELRYDPQVGEGVACGNGLGAAIRGAPFSVRFFADAAVSPLDRLAMTWGCDWDPTTRRVYSAIPNLGMLYEIDYDTGRVEKRWFVGLGMRSVAYDRVRKRVYLTDFLRGEVVAFDEESERVVSRWFVGRFSRWVRLTRDGSALLATGNLGIVRIPLAG